MNDWWSKASRLTDPYDRQARLSPALLALLPLLVFLGFEFGPKNSISTNVGGALIFCGALYLLSSIARELGKRLEQSLYSEWGGMPSIQLLRHANNLVDAVTKKRYHQFLAPQLKIKFPTEAQEKAEPNSADQIYESATKWLLSRTRDRHKFELLFKENISYGFRRNALGLKPLALFLALLCIVAIAGTSDYPRFSEPAIFGLVLSILNIAIWTMFFTKVTVKTAAYTFAQTLLNSCDLLAGSAGNIRSKP